MDILLNIAKSAGIIVLIMAISLAGIFLRSFPFFMSDRPVKKWLILIAIIGGFILGIMASAIIVWT